MSVDDDVDAGQGLFGRCQAPEVVQLVEAGIIPFGGVVLEHMTRASPAILHSPSVATFEPELHIRYPSQLDILSSEPDSVSSLVRQNSTPASQVVAEPSDSGVQFSPMQDHVVQSMDAAAVMTAARRRSLSIMCVVDRPGSGLCWFM